MSDGRTSAPSCLVIGSGMAGLTAARALHDAGVRARVVDKGRGVGGRMATRRFEGGVFDHGAQFITVRDPRFQESMRRWQTDGVAELWSGGFSTASGAEASSGYARYRGRPAMTAIPKALAAGVDIELSVRVHSLHVADNRWRVYASAGDQPSADKPADNYLADALILTPPAPQSLALLDAGGVRLPEEMDRQIRGIAYHPCLALLALFDAPTRIPAPGGLQFGNGPIQWMADNKQKGISPDAVAVTIHAAPDFSRRHWDTPDELVAQQLLVAGADWLPAPAREWRVHRWRYSRPVNTDMEHAASYDVFASDPPIAFAGDAFAGGRVEGAALSGLRAAERIIQALALG